MSNYYDVQSIIYGQSENVAQFIKENSTELQMVTAEAEFTLTKHDGNHVISLVCGDMDWEDTTSICVAWDVLMDNAKEAGLKYQRVMKNMETGDSDEMISPEPDFLIGWKSQSVVKL